jgi:hypothetical protein
MTLYRPKIYTASVLKYYHLWMMMRTDPDWEFCEFTATWPSIAHLEDEAPSEALFRDAWMKDVAEVKVSDFLLLYGTDREALRGALVEAGVAIGFGIPVLTIGVGHEQTWTYHPGVQCFGSLREARQHLLRYTTMAPPTRRKKGRPNEPDSK